MGTLTTVLMPKWNTELSDLLEKWLKEAQENHIDETVAFLSLGTVLKHRINAISDAFKENPGMLANALLNFIIKEGEKSHDGGYIQGTKPKNDSEMQSMWI